MLNNVIVPSILPFDNAHYAYTDRSRIETEVWEIGRASLVII